MSLPVIAVFAGGTSAEREVSTGSGAACSAALARSFTTRLFDVTAEALPDGFDPRRHAVFSTLHGTFGEDGGMQRLLDAAGGAYAGCDAESSRLTMDKDLTKRTVSAAGVLTIEGVTFDAGDKPSAAELQVAVGASAVVKPNSEGSSVGLKLADGPGELEAALRGIERGRWIVERRIVGRELSVGILRGSAMGIVEYLAPAPIGEALTSAVTVAAETAFGACGCRDYARVDFILSRDGEPFFLEINTLPGMKETSLLPMSARCAGLDFAALVREMVSPAVERFRSGLASRRP